MMKNKNQELTNTPPSASAGVGKAPPTTSQAILRRHLRLGWWSLFVFLTLGLALESLHFMNVDAYLSTANSTRRLMWTLAHAHGTLLGLINLGFAFTLPFLQSWREGSRRWASRLLVGATILMPGGFFLGGVIVYEGDPSPGILLLPIGGLMLFGAVLLAVAALRRAS